VACALTNQPPDAQHLPAVTAQIEANLGHRPARLLADNGYWSAANAAWLEAQGIDGYLATGRDHHGGAPPGEVGGPGAKAQMRAKLASAAGQAEYARRKAIVEPVFGQLKSARGFRRLARRGLAQARSEWALLCTAHNVLKLWRAGQGEVGPEPVNGRHEAIESQRGWSGKVVPTVGANHRRQRRVDANGWVIRNGLLEDDLTA
ncbi:MAG: transposase, partial [Fimbriimonadaceae bacterium]|nr:transposase [Fimbriimonadaceae bacterium]